MSRSNSYPLFHSFAVALAALMLCATLTGCVVAGVSSGGGFFIWPGSIGILVLVLIVIWIARRR